MSLKCRVLSFEPALVTVNSARDFTGHCRTAEEEQEGSKAGQLFLGLQLTTSGDTQPQGQS